MLAHTNEYKQEMRTFGREIDIMVTYDNITLGNETIMSATPNFQADIMKSVMKQLDLESKIEIPKGTIINFKQGVKVRNAEVEDYRDNYDYINYGNYIVHEIEKNEDDDSYKLVCYDKMLYTMADYEDLGITYPVTIREFIKAICDKVGLQFKNTNDTFANYDKQVTKELFLDIEYTYRDVLDELAQVTASTICINEQTDELEIRYPKNTGDYTTVEGSVLTLANVEDERDIELQLQGNTSQNGTPTPTTPVNVEVVTGGQNIEVCGRNLLKSNLEMLKANNTTGTWNGNTYTLNNVSFTYNEDGSITANGTASANTYFYISRNTPYEITTLPAGTYYFTSHEYTGANDTWKIQFNTGSAINVFGTGSAKEQTRTLTEDINTTARIVVYSEKNPNGATFYPMIAKQSGVAYEKYNGNTYEINLGKNIIYNKNGTTSGEYGGVQYTFNEDGTIHAEGTATTNYNLYLMSGSNQLVLSPGTYTLSSGGGTTNYWLRLFDGTNYQDTANNGIKTFTITQTTSYDCVIRVRSGYTIDFTFKPMLEKGSTATPYLPYKTPIELCKIDTYQDSIKKAIGKNLLNLTSTTAYGYTSGMPTVPVSNLVVDEFNSNLIKYHSSVGGYYYVLSNIINLKPNTTYTISFSRTTTSTNNQFFIYDYDNGTYSINYRDNNTNVYTKTFTTNNLGQIVLGFGYGNQTGTTTISNIQIEENNQATSYEPYGIGWYIEKQIGKVVLDGSEEWYINSNVFNIRNIDNYMNTDRNTISTISNYYKAVPNANGSSEAYSRGNNTICLYYQNTTPRIFIRNDDYTTTDTFKTWLSTHNTIVYYVLANPTYTFIEDEELINQLNNVRLLEGLNNIIVSSSDLSSPLKLKYISERETLDESVIKNTQASFGSDYGYINYITLTNGEIPEDVCYPEVEPEEKVEIKIKNNEFLTGTNRSQFAKDIYDQLNKIKYCENDFSTTGIGYLALCDKFTAQANGQKYTCIMFNNETEITQGISEHIYTDIPEKNEPVVKKTDKAEQMTSKIIQRENEITLSVSQKLDSDEFTNAQITAKINDGTSAVQISADKISLAGKTIDMTSDEIAISSTNFSVDKNGDITAHSATLEDIEIKDGQIYIPIIVDYDYTMADYQRALDIYLGTIQPTQEDLDKYDINGDGQIDLQDVMTILKLVRTGLSHSNPGKIIFKADGANSKISIINGLNRDIVKFDFNGINVTDLDNNVTTIRAGSIGIRQGTNIVEIYPPEILYDDATGTKGTITINESAYNFKYIEIFYYKEIGNNRMYASQKVFEPNNKDVMIIGTWYGQDTGASVPAMYIYREKLSISNTTITRSEVGASFVNTNGQCGAFAPDGMNIVRIIGYR